MLAVVVIAVVVFWCMEQAFPTLLTLLALQTLLLLRAHQLFLLQLLRLLQLKLLMLKLLLLKLRHLLVVLPPLCVRPPNCFIFVNQMTAFLTVFLLGLLLLILLRLLLILLPLLVVQLLPGLRSA